MTVSGGPLGGAGYPPTLSVGVGLVVVGWWWVGGGGLVVGWPGWGGLLALCCLLCVLLVSCGVRRCSSVGLV